jgi:hypothetical protein
MACFPTFLKYRKEILFDSFFDQPSGSLMFGRDLSLGIEPGMFDDELGGYLTGICRRGKKIGSRKI